jgi:hypothetical protein
VDEHVDPQVLFFRESLSTGGLRALKRLCTIVKVQVRLQADPPSKDLLAALVGAFKHYLLPVGVQADAFVSAFGLFRGLGVLWLRDEGLWSAHLTSVRGALGSVALAQDELKGSLVDGLPLLKQKLLLALVFALRIDLAVVNKFFAGDFRIFVGYAKNLWHSID